jgi:hypothetical protein
VEISEIFEKRTQKSFKKMRPKVANLENALLPKKTSIICYTAVTQL